MAIPRIPRHRRLRTVIIVAALCAAGLGADRGPVDRLIEQLRAGNAPARSDAALRLGLLGPRAAFAMGALDSALDDPDPSVRANAMYSLVRLGSRSPRLLPILAEQIEATPGPNKWGKWDYPRAVGIADPPEGWTVSNGGLEYNDPLAAQWRIRPDPSAFVPLLAKALTPQDRQAREAALAKTYLTPLPGVVSKTREDWARAAALRALCGMATWSDPSSPELAGALLATLAVNRFGPHATLSEAHDELRERMQVVDALAKLDRAAREKAEAQLARDLRDLGSPRSYEAAVLLPRLPGGRSTLVSILLESLRDGDGLRRRIAMLMLQPMAGPTEAPAVLRAITSPGAERKMRLNPFWWKSIREGRVYLGVGSYTEDRSLIELGHWALQAMGASVEWRSIHDLVVTLREPDGNRDRRRVAIIALGEFGPDAAEAIPVLGDVIRAAERSHQGPSWGPDHEASPGALATAALGKIGSDGNPEALAILAGLIEVPGAPFGPDAALALDRLGPKARPAVPALAKALKDPRQAVRLYASAALGKIGGPEVRAVMPALVAALDDQDLGVRANAAEALAAYGPDAAEAIPAMLVSLEMAGPWRRDEIRESLDRILPRTPGATVAESIAAMRSNDPAKRSRAAYELGRLIEESRPPAEAVAALGEATGDSDPQVRRMAVAVLGRLAPRAPEAGPPLSRAARDPDGSVRRLAAWGLGRARR
jgi:HEAT repeat protein